MSYRKALKDAERFLEQAGVPDAGIDAWYLMEYVLKQNGISDAGRSWYFLHCEEEMPENCQVAYQKLLKKRGERIPLQQLTGEQEFMGFSFLVNLIWILFFGWEMAIGYAVLGLVWCVTILGIPVGKQCFKMAKLALMPFGAEVVG